MRLHRLAAQLTVGLWRSVPLALVAVLLAGCALPAATPAPPSPTPVGAVREAPPSPTPSTTPQPGLDFASIPNPFERRQLAAGEPIAQAGLYFMDVATGAIEAWSLPGAKDAWYRTSLDGRWLIGYPSDAAYAADRRSGAAFRWGRNTPYLLAAQGDYLLLRNSAGQVWVTGPGQPEPVALPCERADYLTVSPDGETAAVVGGRTLYLVQLKSVTCRAVGELAAPPEGYTQSAPFVATTGRGDEILLTTFLTAGSGANQKTERRVERYSWQGERLGELTLPSGLTYNISPDGRWVAWEERLSHLTYAVVVADAATLAPRFRILGAVLCFPDYGGGLWLADSSAFVVRTSAGYGIVTRDGDIVASPALSAATGEPLPAPDRADLFAIGRHMVVDAAGKPVATAALPADRDLGRPADLYPWGLDSHELRFALPHLGHGGKCGEAEYLLPVRVELAPFSPLVLSVGLPAGDCINLRAEPGTSAQVLTCLPGGTRLSPAPLAEPRQSQGKEPYYLTQSIAWADNSRWLRVRAPDGQEGWVDAEAGKVGWVK